jgi:transposase-like protein
MMLDGLEIAGRVHVVALGVSTEGVKVPLGLWEGSKENATLARSLLADLVDRGLDPGQAILFVLDGGKHVAFLVAVTAMHQCGLAEHVADRGCWPGSAAPGR